MKKMKWPKSLLLIRHDVSKYNILKEEKSKSSLYQDFLLEFGKDPDSIKTKDLAKVVAEKFSIEESDANTFLVDMDSKRAEEVGVSLRKDYSDQIPDIIFVSPYKRALLTLEGLMRGWPELRNVPIVEDERIREQEHGLANLYNDGRVFHSIHPEQRLLYEKEGSYWYRYPQGENVPDIRVRNYSWMATIVRDFSEKNVLAVTHHLNILGLRANLERWSADKFIQTNNEDRPINCGVTLYQGNPNEGKEGHFELKYYNHKFYI